MIPRQFMSVSRHQRLCDEVRHCLPRKEIRAPGRQFFMESIVVACITGMVTLVGVILSNLKSRAVMELKIDALAEKVEKHNQLVERTYQLQQDVAVVRNDIEALCKRTEATT